ncbi:MAG TPA: hypothetical protein VFG86_02000 [Chloroflexota bacterium]|nr:hypothetical protein [Chloroflexota bacterium]
MTAPFLDPRRRRSILQAQAVIRALDALRGNREIGVGTQRRLAGPSAQGTRNVGINPVELLRAVSAKGPEADANLIAARQEALANWSARSMAGGPAQGRYQAPPVSPSTQAVLAQRARTANTAEARRQELLARTGPAAISPDLRNRILARRRRLGFY